MIKPPKELIDGFYLWFNNDQHKQFEDFYRDVSTHDSLAAMAKDQFVEFMVEFTADGGKIQSGGHRTKNLFRETVLENYEAFRAFILNAFTSDLDVRSWLRASEGFKYFGRGIATIFLNRIDKRKYVVANNKTADALELFGVKLPVDFVNRYEAVKVAQDQLLSWYPEFDNYYRTDAFNHYLIGTDEGRQLFAALNKQEGKGMRYWVCGLGEGAKFWEECRENSILVFGLDELPSLSNYKSKEELKQAIVEEGSRGTNPYNDALAGWQFANEIKQGDIIIPKRGTKTYLGYGIVSGSYRQDSTRAIYRNVIPVEWKKVGEWEETEGKIIIKTLTDITPYPDYVKRLINLIGIETDEYSLDAMSELTGEIRPILLEYVKQFIERASSGSQDLTQIPISAELSEVSHKIGIYFKTSFGMGYPTKIPWLACFLPNQSASVEGVYPVLLYRKEQRSVTVNYGVSATAQKTEGSWPRKWSDESVKGLSHFPDKKYGASYLYEAFEEAKSDDYEQITDAFIKVIGDFITQQNGGTVDPIPRPTTIPLPSLEGIGQIANLDFARASLRFQETSIVRYVSSLLTKRFVILTGLSGSGKTKLAHAFASWLSQTQDQYRLVAVGADWTSNENVLGYQDALQPTIYRKPASGALDLILRAEKNPALPYFLILDEMNLSHVERYFADILSAIESGQKIALHASNEKLCSFTGDPLPVPAKIRLPENLFVVGTVNIDETTYMFSPKVLDRANVIEFRATVEDIAGFLDALSKVDMEVLAGKGAAFGQAFVNSARNSVSLADLPPTIGNGSEIAINLKLRLIEVFSELVPIGAEFGFRTALEISSFFYHHAILNGSSWQFNAALDAQVIQKLMPKLHGSDRKLRPTLEKLKKFCEEHQLPLSTEKLNRMLDRLAQDGFTSFAEA